MKKYQVSWIESRVIQNDVHTFVLAKSKEEALTKVIHRVTEKPNPLYSTSQFIVKYKGKSK